VRFIYSSLQLTDIQDKPRRFTLVWCFQKADSVIPDVVWATHEQHVSFHLTQTTYKVITLRVKD
jgi:hypothetical protein